MPDYVWLISTCQGSGMNNQTHKELRMRWWRRTSTTNCSPCTTDVAPTIWMRNVLWFLSPQQNQLFTVLRSDVVPSYHGKSMHRAKRYHIVYNLILMSHVLIWFYTCFSLQVPRRINGDSQRWDFSFDSIWSICSFAPRMLSINILNGPHWVLMCKVSAFDNLSTTSLLSKLDKILYFCLRIALSLLRLLSSGHVSFLLYLLVSGLCYQSCFHASAL
jgi:hypothetical protein